MKGLHTHAVGVRTLVATLLASMAHLVQAAPPSPAQLAHLTQAMHQVCLPRLQEARPVILSPAEMQQTCQCVDEQAPAALRDLDLEHPERSDDVNAADAAKLRAVAARVTQQCQRPHVEATYVRDLCPAIRQRGFVSVLSEPSQAAVCACVAHQYYDNLDHIRTAQDATAVLKPALAACTVKAYHQEPKGLTQLCAAAPSSQKATRSAAELQAFCECVTESRLNMPDAEVASVLLGAPTATYQTADLANQKRCLAKVSPN